MAGRSSLPADVREAWQRFTQRLEDEAIRRAHEGVVKLVIYKGRPVVYRGELVVEHAYSDQLMIKLLEANDPDRFNRQRVVPFDGGALNLDNLTEGQLEGLIDWLHAKARKRDEDRRERAPK